MNPGEESALSLGDAGFMFTCFLLALAAFAVAPYACHMVARSIARLRGR
jgi:hypothetical protein